MCCPRRAGATLSLVDITVADNATVVDGTDGAEASMGYAMVGNSMGVDASANEVVGH